MTQHPNQAFKIGLPLLCLQKQHNGNGEINMNIVLSTQLREKVQEIKINKQLFFNQSGRKKTKKQAAVASFCCATYAIRGSDFFFLHSSGMTSEHLLH